MDLEHDSIVTEADHTWEHEGLALAIYMPPINKGYLSLPDILVGAWKSANEICQALELSYKLAYGPHPDIIGYPENERWVGVDGFDIPMPVGRKKRVYYDEYVTKKIHARLYDLSKRLLTAAEFARLGYPMTPVTPTVTRDDVVAMARDTGDGRQRAVVPLKRGESAWYPDRGYKPLNGPLKVTYEFHRGKVSVTAMP